MLVMACRTAKEWASLSEKRFALHDVRKWFLQNVAFRPRPSHLISQQAQLPCGTAQSMSTQATGTTPSPGASRHLHNTTQGPLREDDGRRAGPSRLAGCEQSPATVRGVSDVNAVSSHQPLDVVQHTVCHCAKLAVQSHDEAQRIVALSRVEWKVNG